MRVCFELKTHYGFFMVIPLLHLYDIHKFIFKYNKKRQEVFLENNLKKVIKENDRPPSFWE